MKLLNYTSYRYMLFSALLTLISIPVFYFSLTHIFLHATDKYLHQEADGLPAYIRTIESERDLQLWRSLDKDLTIVPAQGNTFSSQPFNVDHHRVLQKKVMIMDRPYIINIKTSLYEKEELIRIILYIQLGILFLLLCGAVLINYLINRKVWKPFYDCLQHIQQFDVERFAINDPEQSNILEFEQLNQSVYQLLKRLHRSYYSQKEFLENVSHELKTPITILKFKLELFLQEQELTEDQTMQIADIHKEIGQMQELNNNLLLLSKIDNGQFAMDEQFNMIHLVQEVVEELSFLASSKLQHFHTGYEVEEMELVSNRMLTKILVRNLLVNAVRYTDQEAVIHVLIYKDRLVIRNPGNPLVVPATALFERFGSPRKGLGLAIVKNIADYSQYEITYEYVDGLHTFSVILNRF